LGSIPHGRLHTLIASPALTDAAESQVREVLIRLDSIDRKRRPEVRVSGAKAISTAIYAINLGCLRRFGI